MSGLQGEACCVESRKQKKKMAGAVNVEKLIAIRHHIAR